MLTFIKNFLKPQGKFSFTRLIVGLVLVFFTYIAIEVALDWEDYKNGFIKGFEEGYRKGYNEGKQSF